MYQMKGSIFKGFTSALVPSQRKTSINMHPLKRNSEDDPLKQPRDWTALHPRLARPKLADQASSLAVTFHWRKEILCSLGFAQDGRGVGRNSRESVLLQHGRRCHVDVPMRIRDLKECMLRNMLVYQACGMMSDWQLVGVP